MLSVYTLDQEDEWKKVVCSFRKYDVYYLPGYVKAFQIHGDGEPILIYWTQNKDATGTRGINVVMLRDVSKDKHFEEALPDDKFFDLSTPYGYGGWLIENSFSDKDTGQEEIKQLFIDYERWCQYNNIISEFVRFHPMLENQRGCECSYTVIPLGETVAMDLSSPEEIFNNLTSKNRNVIRKAIKNDVKIYNGRFPEAYEAFKTIYDVTMDKDGADPYYYFEDEFYQSLLNDLSENAQVFWAEKDRETIAASIMLGCNGYMNYHLSGSVKKYSGLAATNLILYKAALWGCANGYRTLYLGGGVGSGEDSLYKFKKAFYKGNLHRFYIGKKVFDQEKYAKLCKLRGIDSHSEGFFPRYRA